MTMTERILLLPGWLDSGPDHWQSRWEALHGDTRVAQSDWLWPRRGDWMARLEEVLLESDTPALLVAQVAQFVDLDGPLLLAQDRPNGIDYRDGLAHPPSAALWG